MSVKINVYYFLPHLTDDQEVIEVDGVVSASVSNS